MNMEINMNYIIVYSDELNHYGVKGMRWGVRRDKPPRGRHAYKVDGRTPTRKEYRQIKRTEKEFNKQAKKEYKYARKVNLRESNKVFKTYVDSTNANRKQFSDYKKNQKSLLKGKSIDKETYKQNVKKARAKKFAANNAAEARMAIGQYKIQKSRHINKMVYAQDIGDIKAYEKGKKAYDRSSESFSYGNSMYTVKKKPNGSYSISRTDVYVY